MNNIESVSVNRKMKCLTKEQLNNMTKEELIDRIIQLEAHNKQLKNVIQKNINSLSTGSGAALKQQKEFDFAKANYRHVLLKFYYLGWTYQGFAAQEDSVSTIEYHIFNALMKTCLIEKRETSNYHRCGRTDKGVSAFCQVISIDIRTKYETEAEQNDDDNIKNEIDYCKILNRVLPTNIRCLAWMPRSEKLYSSRFDCIQRTYRYFFPRGQLNIALMKEGCQKLMGIHDFRNLCKMDVANGVIAFMREITYAEIHLAAKESDTQLKDSGYDMFYFELTGLAFLWHQVRCIMAVLILIGQENEEPSIIDELFNVEKNPQKPHYCMASDMPLNLYRCEFRRNTKEFDPDHNDDNTYEIEQFTKTFEEEDKLETSDWRYEEQNLKLVIGELQEQWSLQNIGTTMMREMLKTLESLYKTISNDDELITLQANTLLMGVKSKQYQKLLTRKKCQSLENRIEHFVKKRRLDIQTTIDDNNPDL